ncbi:TlpA family protein disulfide reductase [Rufibacter hautae]|uniref:Thioredoxin family protein n=1 Tax=Rufibacter hautae TaxID=2595005 RepID=A0A5B6TBD3_9BACT|nr:thioredoxin family protein [Rufibacter hautae]KAA3437787.1 thioredoxin family protein [Rufibacter hautae]
MKRIAYSILLASLSWSCTKEVQKSEEVLPAEKVYLGSTEGKIQKYREDSQKYWDKGDSENAQKYRDSIKAVVVNTYLKEYTFTSLSGSVFETARQPKPMLLQITASWCVPCRAEIPALNQIVEKFQDQIDFVLLFQDQADGLTSLAKEYNSAITLVPSHKEVSDPNTIDIAGFRHTMGFPSNYLVTAENKVVNFTQGAQAPRNYTGEDGKEVIITVEEANRQNFERLEAEIKDLLQKSAVHNF